MPNKTPQKLISHSAEETRKFGELFAKEILKNFNSKNQPRIFALKGDLGSGKTTFMQGVAKGLRIKEKILSPTFVIMKDFKLNPHRQWSNVKCQMSPKKLYHLDCYRLENEKDLEALNFEKIINPPAGGPKNLIFIEWPERIKKTLLKQILWIEFKTIGENEREIKIASE